MNFNPSGPGDVIIKKALKYLLLFPVMFVAVPVQGIGPLQPLELTCEFMKDPLGIAEQKPRLTWTLQATRRAQMQSAYELIVSDDLNLIQQAKGNVWETGKVISGQNILVA